MTTPIGIGVNGQRYDRQPISGFNAGVVFVHASTKIPVRISLDFDMNEEPLFFAGFEPYSKQLVCPSILPLLAREQLEQFFIQGDDPPLPIDFFG
jgi:hypothetical protein